MKQEAILLSRLTLLCALGPAIAACEPTDKPAIADATTDTDTARDADGQNTEDATTATDADPSDSADTAIPPAFDAQLRAVYWVDSPAGDASTPPMLAVEVMGLPFDRVAEARVTVSGRAGDDDIRFTASATGAEVAEVFRVGSGAGWSAPLDGEATFTLHDLAGATLLTLSGHGAKDGLARFEGSADGATLAFSVQTHLAPREVWTDAGLVPVEGPPTWEVIFGVRAPVSLAPSALNDLSALEDATTWAMRVNAQQVCTERTGCDEPTFVATRQGAALSPTPFSRFLIPIPDARGVEGDRATVDVTLDMGAGESVQLFGAVLALNTSKERRAPGVPVVGAAGAMVHLVPMPAPPTSADLPAAGVQTVLAVTVSDWNAYDSTFQEKSASVRLRDGDSDAWDHWPDLPIHSFQALTDVVVDVSGDPTGFVYALEVGDDPTALGDLVLVAGDAGASCDASDLARRGYGVCARWLHDEGRWVLSITAFSFNPDALPTTVPARLYARDAKNGTGPAPTADYDLVFDEALAAVFGVTAALRTFTAHDAPLGVDPIGNSTNILADFVSGSRTTSGTASAALVSSGASLGFAPAANRGGPSSQRSPLEGGLTYPRIIPIAEGGGTYTVPPLVVMQTTPTQKSNGKGTRNVASNTNSAPQLL